jgi:glycosyltransferase involved in cell wall biosynthesis
MMKVLHVITGLGNGGAEGALFRLCQGAEREGVEAEVVSLTGRDVYAERLEAIGIRVTHLGMKGAASLPGAILRLVRLIRSRRPDVVQTWMYHADLAGGLAARLAGVRAIAWSIRHSNLDAAHNQRMTLLVARICAALSRWIPRRIVSCSYKASEVHVAHGYDEAKFVFVPNGFDCGLLRRDDRLREDGRAAFAVTGDAPVLGMVARFDPQKDHRNLFRALGRLRDAGREFTFLLVGPGITAENAALVALIDAHGLGGVVRMLGPQANIPRLMNTLDVHILSSLGEAFPNVVAEAMACGTPCVATDAGDARRIMDGHGWVAPIGDDVALAAAMAQAMDERSADAERWESRRVAARAHIVATYSLESMTRGFSDTWRQVLSGDPAATGANAERQQG